MAKRGNPNLNSNAQERKNRTINLIRKAVKSLEDNYEIKGIKEVSAKTKEIDPNDKGVSEATFRNKELEHIQSLMLELRIGKYEALSVGTSEKESEIADQLLKAKKEIEKKDKEIKKLRQNKKKLNTKIDELVIDNKELRAVIYELDMKNRLKMDFKAINNKI